MATNHTIITVIVPVYNAQRTIERCVRSLFEQTMTTGIEFLFIDDCSTDHSLAILSNTISLYPSISPQVTIIKNDNNLGVSKTRKRGIKEAKGDYIAWVDSDDWVDSDMLENFWKATDNGRIDIVVQNVLMESISADSVETWEWKLYASESPKQAMKDYHTEKHVPWGLPFQMSRRILLAEASKHVHNVNIMEDTVMLIYLFAISTSCVWLEKAFYHYECIIGGNSLTHRKFQTKEEWNKQVPNIDDVTTFLLALDKKSYRLTSNYIKWHWKNKFIDTFNNSWEFWKTYRDCYQDVIYLDKRVTDSVFHKIKTWLRFNFYPLYWYKEGRYQFCNDRNN